MIHWVLEVLRLELCISSRLTDINSVLEGGLRSTATVCYTFFFWTLKGLQVGPKLNTLSSQLALLASKYFFLLLFSGIPDNDDAHSGLIIVYLNFSSA